jgi:uncharacterized protein (DUF305 family)
MDEDHAVQDPAAPRLDGPGGDALSGTGPGAADRSGRPSWVHVLVVGAALAFLGFAVGLVVARDRAPADSSVDVGFTHDMITHHDQALQVATLGVAYGENPVVGSYAREILVFQAYELGLMDQKLAEWGTSRGERSDEAMAWMNMPVPVEQMPGLLSEEQMEEIRSAEGAELDALFLERMAEHHRGGLHMAEYAAREADDDDVRTLATRIARNQAGEINEYRAAAEAQGIDVDIEPATLPADLAP